MILFLSRTCRDWKFYQSYFWHMSCMQGESGRETLCSQTSRNWKRWTHLKLMQKDSTRRKWLRPKLVISICDWEKSKTTWTRSGSENIHLDKGQRRTRRSAWKPSRRVRRLSSTNTTRLNARWRWSPKWFLVEHGELHLPSSCWTQSQTPCVERRDSPNSTAICWRFEGYKYGLGCIAGTSCWRLLEHWWGSRIIWCTVRIYMDNPLGRKTSRRIYLVWETPYKKTSNIHVRSLVSRNVDKYVRRCSTMRKAKVGHRKTETRQCVKTTRSLLRWPGRHRVQGNSEKR